MTDMEKDALRRKIAVMEAAERGQRIEIRKLGESGWSLSPNPEWNWQKFDYRIGAEESVRRDPNKTPEICPPWGEGWWALPNGVLPIQGDEMFSVFVGRWVDRNHRQWRNPCGDRWYRRRIEQPTEQKESHSDSLPLGRLSARRMDPPRGFAGTVRPELCDQAKIPVTCPDPGEGYEGIPPTEWPTAGCDYWDWFHNEWVPLRAPADATYDRWFRRPLTHHEIGEPLKIDNATLDWLRMGRIREHTESRFKIGDFVRITKGTFSGTAGEVFSLERIEDGLVQVAEIGGESVASFFDSELEPWHPNPGELVKIVGPSKTGWKNRIGEKVQVHQIEENGDIYIIPIDHRGNVYPLSSLEPTE